MSAAPTANEAQTQLDLPTLIQGLKNLRSDSFGSDVERREAASALSEALDEVELPVEKYAKFVWPNTTLYSTLQIASDLDLFKKWIDSGKEVQTHTQLAQLVNVEPAFLTRILKHLASMRVLKEPEPDTYKQTAYSQFFANARTRGGWEFVSIYMFPTFGKLPEYFRKNGYRWPSAPDQLPFQYGLDFRDGDFWDWIKSDERASASFNSLMSAYASNQGCWFDVYPLDAELQALQSEDSDARRGGEKLLVDVAGGRGQDIERLVARFPSVDTKSLVLQDLADVLKEAHVPDGVEVMPHDFFTEQPVKGARYYYLHWILHDWPLEQCQTILSKLRDAMKPGWSKIMIAEIVVSAKEAHPQATALDIAMAASYGTSEKREDEWRALIEGVEGLRVKKMWSGPGSVESVFEVELA
ncbi:MAG: hypothetical protein M1831_001523 [Alyxoria varia]|nr:MAG: hypothetical protein M1831_001523 [Alyxoria varia]